MLVLLTALVTGAGMFCLGWLARSHFGGTPTAEAPTGPATSRWVCPSCDLAKELPASLDDRVKLCNACQVRLRRVV